MKKVTIIFITMVMVCCFAAMAHGEMIDEIRAFALDNRATEPFGRTIGGCTIIGDHAYMIADFRDTFSSPKDLMENYREKWLKKWPEFNRDVKVEFTLTGRTENYDIYCIWLDLENGKTMSDYSEGEPNVAHAAALVGFKRTDKIHEKFITEKKITEQFITEDVITEDVIH